MAAVGGTGRSPSWRVSSAFIRTGSTTGRSSCWTGRRAFSKAAVARACWERGVSKSVVLLTGDRGFESIQRRVRCEPDLLDQGHRHRDRRSQSRSPESHRFLAKVPAPRRQVRSVPAFRKMRVQAATRTFTDVSARPKPLLAHDSPLEGTGFEPLVPLENESVSRIRM